MDTLFNIFAVPGFGEITLVVSMIFVVVLLLGLLIWSKWHWGIKASTTIAAGMFFALTYFSIIEMQGWPTKAEMPEKIQLIWYYIDAPNKQMNKAGFIVLWALEDNKRIGRKPRAYQIPYTLEMHKKLHKMKKQLSSGKTGVRGEKTKRKGKKGTRADSTLFDMNFYKMPKANPPRKH